jgi:tRNA1(Val) A37 N6-methylase TrmN6
LSDAGSADGALTCSVTDDAFLGGALNVLQPAVGYRAGLDGVLLAAAVAAEPGQRVLDVGAGVGVVGLAVARRLAETHVTMLERDPQFAALARRNIARNGLADRVSLVEGDLVRPLGEIAGLAGAAESFDHVVANPPFNIEGYGTAAGDPGKAAANAMPPGALHRWMRFMAAMARPGGTVTLIHRADALHDILDAMSRRFGGMLILPVHSREAEPASRVIVQAVKGSRAALELRPGLVLHRPDQGFLPDVEAILRRGCPLSLRRASAGS